MFGFFDKKNNAPATGNAANQAEAEDFQKRLLQNIVKNLSEKRVLHEPSMVFWPDAEKGFEVFYRYNTAHPNFCTFVEEHPDAVLQMSGCQNFGAAVFMLYDSFNAFGKKITDLSEEELDQMINRIGNQDPFLLGMSVLNLEPDSQNVQVIEWVVGEAVELVRKLRQNLEVLNDDYAFFCRAFYIAGFNFMVRLMKTADENKSQA